MMATPSNLAIIALPLETTTTFRHGTAHAPEAIIHEIENIDTFDLSLGRAPFRGVPRTIIRPHDASLSDARIQQSISARVVGEVLDQGGFPLSLGGEHTVTLGPLRACRLRGEIGIVQLDAHADLRDEHRGNRHSHACVMCRALEMSSPVLGVGIRAISAIEAQFVKDRNLQLVDGRSAATRTDWYSMLKNMPDRIYLSVDMDVFDPSEVPDVVTPVPGGPGWHQICDFLVHLFSTKTVVGADIVELVPGPESAASIRAAARLAGFITGLRFKR